MKIDTEPHALALIVAAAQKMLRDITGPFELQGSDGFAVKARLLARANEAAASARPASKRPLVITILRVTPLSEDDPRAVRVRRLLASDQEAGIAGLEARAAQADDRALRMLTRAEILGDRVKSLESAAALRRETDADAAVAQMVAAGQIAEGNTFAKDEWRLKFIKDPSLIPLLADRKPLRASAPKLTRAMWTPR